MKLLPFERRYRLDSTPCETCAGSGRFSAAGECWNCRGLGRRITAAGRDLFDRIAEMLGTPVLQHESRVAPKHFNLVRADQLRCGMRIRPLRDSRLDGFLGGRPGLLGNKLRDVLKVQAHDGNITVTFADGDTVIAADHEHLVRELTPVELDAVDKLMAEHLGAGAVEPES